MKLTDLQLHSCVYIVSQSESLVLISAFCLSPSVPATPLQHKTLRGSSGLGPSTSHPGCPDAVSVCTPTQVTMETTVCLTRLFTTASPSAVTSECSLSMKISRGLFSKHSRRIRPLVTCHIIMQNAFSFLFRNFSLTFNVGVKEQTK